MGYPLTTTVQVYLFSWPAMDLWETQMTKVDSWCEHQRQWESRTGWGRTGCCWGWCCTRGASTRWTCSSSRPCLSGSSISSPGQVEAGFQVCKPITTTTIIIAKHLNRKLKNALLWEIFTWQRGFHKLPDRLVWSALILSKQHWHIFHPKQKTCPRCSTWKKVLFC